jgi:ribonuclease D
VLEEGEAVAGLEPARRRRDPDAFLAIKGASRLPRRALAVLRELHAWRERRAEKDDRPPFKILTNEALLALAQQPPASARELAASRWLPARLKRDAGELFAAVETARAVPESALPFVPVRQRPLVPPALRRRIEALRDWRSAEGARLGLDPAVVLPQRLLERVAEAAPGDPTGLEAVEGLRRWRVRCFGPALVATLAAAGSPPPARVS